MAAPVVTAILALSLARMALAQSNQMTWSATVFVLNGDRDPIITNANPELTPLGAHQLVDAGAAIRTRYVQGPGNNITASWPISGISSSSIDNSELDMLSANDAWTASSAQAFVQGLYPPLGVDNVNPAAMLANGSLLQFPLGGYQYPNIGVISALDFNYIWLAGDVECTEYELSEFAYFGSDDYATMSANSAGFYQSLVPLLYEGIVPASQATYYNAYALWDYANYQFIHNSTIGQNLSSGALAQLYSLASHSEFALNGNLSANGLAPGDQIRAIAGKTFAGRVLTSLGQNIGSQGLNQKLNLMFGSYEPFLAFFSLSSLANNNPMFQTIPLPGSVMAFELYSNPTGESYPDPSELKVRFLFRNGTDPSSPLLSYPLFNRGVSWDDMTWSDFQAQMGNFALENIGTWCTTCSSAAIYCPDFVENQTSGNSTSNSTLGAVSSSNSGVSAPVAGVIGAAVTIAVLGLLAFLAVVVGGVRIHRNTKGDRRATTSSFGGFKGAEKLASDTDLTITKGGAGQPVVRHERVGSWEMGDAKKPTDLEAQEGGAKIDRVVSGADYTAAHDREGDDDAINPFGDPVKVDDRI